MGQTESGKRLTGLAVSYFFIFNWVGIAMPFLSQHLKSLGLSGAEIGLLMAASPVAAIFVPPAWGFLADRTRRTGLLLAVALAGAFLAYLPLLSAETVWQIAPWLYLAALFASPISTLIDSQVLQEIREVGGHFSRVRLWGSVGFIASSAAFGLFYSGARASPPPVIVGVVAALGLAFLSTLPRVRASGAGLAPPSLGQMANLLSEPRLRLLLLSTGLHWAACGPFNLLFTVHLRDLGLPPSVAGVGAATGVVAEVGVMVLWPKVSQLASTSRLLTVAFLGSGLRWLLLSYATGAEAVIAIQLLHGLTYGVFMLAAYGYLTALVPPQMRATGQALFASVTWGMGGAIGYLAAGRLYDLFSGGALFRVAAALELLPALLALALPALTVTDREPVLGSEQA